MWILWLVVVVICIEYPTERNLPFHQSDQEVQGDQVVHCHPKKQMNKSSNQINPLKIRFVERAANVNGLFKNLNKC